MKAIRIISTVALTSFIASSALAASGDIYGKLEGGYALGEAKFTGTAKQNVTNNGFAGNIGMGYCITDNIRADVNFSFIPPHSVKITDRTLAGNKLRTRSYTGLLNGYYDFTGAEIIPYVTLGAGMTNVKASISGNTPTKFDEKTGFAYQAGVGASFEITPKTLLDLGYRFTGTSIGKSTSGGISFKPRQFSHTFLFGGRFSF